MYLGCHVSIAGDIARAFERAAEVDCEAIQIFTQNQRQWRSVRYEQEIVQRFKDSRSTFGFAAVPLTAHASYLINLCAADGQNLTKSRLAFTDELKRCDLLGVDYLVIHPGAHGGKGADWGIKTIAESINLACADYQPGVRILLETTAGQGTSVGHSFEQLRLILDRIEMRPQVAVCADTCHIFAAGYELRGQRGIDELFAAIDSTVGMDQIKVWHLNDSMKELGSRRDRHAAVGKGCIGRGFFEELVNDRRFAKTPGILEIPGGMEIFAEDIAMLKNMRRQGR